MSDVVINWFIFSIASYLTSIFTKSENTKFYERNSRDLWTEIIDERALGFRTRIKKIISRLSACETFFFSSKQYTKNQTNDTYD